MRGGGKLYKLGFMGELVYFGFRGILKNPPMTPKLFVALRNQIPRKLCCGATHNVFLPCRKTVICYTLYSNKQSKRLFFTVANYRFSLRLLKCKENRLVPLAEQFARNLIAKRAKKFLRHFFQKVAKTITLKTPSPLKNRRK